MSSKIQSIGIDVSKKSLDICFMTKQATVLKEFKVSNTAEGVLLTLEQIKAFPCEQEVPICLESTSSYHVLPALMLKEEGHKVKVFNPILSKKYTQASIRKCKTDKADARIIAKIGLLEVLHDFDLSPNAFFLKRKVSLLKTLQKQKQILSASLNKLKEDYEVLKKELPLYLKESDLLKSLKITIKTIQEEIQNEAKHLKGFTSLCEIKGISCVSASIVLAHIADKAFESKQALVAFAGLDVSVKSSGTSVHGKGRLSKRGNRTLRKTLTQIAWGLRMHNDTFKKLAQYHKNKGKHYFEIMAILARKLLHIIYGMFKTNSPFDPARIHLPS